VSFYRAGNATKNKPYRRLSIDEFNDWPSGYYRAIHVLGCRALMERPDRGNVALAGLDPNR